MRDVLHRRAPLSDHVLHTGGLQLQVDCEPGWIADVLLAGSAGELRARGPRDATAADVRLVVESSRRPFPLDGAERLTRGAWTDRGAVVLEDACSSGFTLRCGLEDGALVVRARWVPPARSRVASHVLRARSVLLTRAVLLQYPVLWWAGAGGRAPVHVSALDLGAAVPLLAGPGGVGKSTLTATELVAGHAMTCDNLAVSDGRTVHGIVEPRRTSDGPGARTSRGRREAPTARRLGEVRPTCVVVVQLSASLPEPVLAPVSREEACRALVTGTWMAGELRRFWAFAAALAAGTGLGPASPQVAAVASALTRDLPCHSLTLSRSRAASLSGLLADAVPAPDRSGAATLR